MKEWFGQVRWCAQDLAEALVQEGYKASEENVGRLYDKLCNSHGFVDYMIGAGWEYISTQIQNMDDLEEDVF